MDALNRSGIPGNQIDSIVFDVTDERRQKLRKNALQQAAGMAEAKVSTLADRLGVGLGSPTSVMESNYNIYPFESSYEHSVRADAAPTEPLLGDITVAADITVEYRIQ